MEIPGISVLSGQPTLTNPLSRESLLSGQAKPSEKGSEGLNTVTAVEKPVTDVNGTDAITQAEKTESARLDTNTFGGSIDILV